MLRFLTKLNTFERFLMILWLLSCATYTRFRQGVE
jgi:hypothetical protein